MKKNQKNLLILGAINIPLAIIFIIIFACSFINFGQINYFEVFNVILWVFSSIIGPTVILINIFIILLIGSNDWQQYNHSKTCAWVLCLIFMIVPFLPGIIALYWSCSVVADKKNNLSTISDDKLKEIKDILNK